MSDVERAEELTPASPRAGERLRAAREAQGLSLAAVADRTRVPLRHLEAIEVGEFDALPSPTYATGFARAYARAVGIDEVPIAAEVRAETARLGRRQPEYEPYVTADPARLPSRGLAIAAAGVALAVIVLVALWLGSGWIRERPTDVAAAPVVAVPVTRPVPAPTPVAPRQVTLAAADTVWLRVYDAANKTLFLGTMKPGDRFDVPQGADHPMINVGRPDKLQVTLDGRPIAPLGTGERPIKDVAVDAAAIAARPAGTPLAIPTPATSGTPTPQPTSTAGPRGDEVQRANRQSERAAARGEAPATPTP